MAAGAWRYSKRSQGGCYRASLSSDGKKAEIVKKGGSILTLIFYDYDKIFSLSAEAIA